jgi:hypothetical protein
VCKCHGNYEYTFVYKITIERKKHTDESITSVINAKMTGILGSLELKNYKQMSFQSVEMVSKFVYHY